LIEGHPRDVIRDAMRADYLKSPPATCHRQENVESGFLENPLVSNRPQEIAENSEIMYLLELG